MTSRWAEVSTAYVLGYATLGEQGSSDAEWTSLDDPSLLFLDGVASIDDEWDENTPVRGTAEWELWSDHSVLPAPDDVVSIHGAGRSWFTAVSQAPSTVASGNGRSTQALEFEIDERTDYTWTISNSEDPEDTEGTWLRLDRMQDNGEVDDNFVFIMDPGVHVRTGTLHPARYRLYASGGGNGSRRTSWSYDFALDRVPVPEPEALAQLAIAIGALVLLRRRRAALAIAGIAALGGAPAYAQGTTEIGDAAYLLEVYLLDADDGGLDINLDHEGTLLDSADDTMDAGGGIEIDAPLGVDRFGYGRHVEAVVENGGQTFWGIAESIPGNTELWDEGWRGSAARTEIYQSYRKDTEEARLTFTYTGAYLALTMPPDTPPRNDDPLRAEASWSYAVYQDSDEEIASESQEVQLFFLDGWYLFHIIGASGTARDLPDHVWEFLCMPCGQSTGHAGAELDEFTHHVDLRGIDVGEEFTVVYQLMVGAFNDLHPMAKAYAWSRDPLGSDGGVAFEIEGLTPTNAPHVPVPEPASVLSFPCAVAVLHRLRRGRARIVGA